MTRSHGTPFIGLTIRFSLTGITAGCIMTGTKRSGAVPTSTPKNSGGVTPTMVNGVPESEIGLPTTAGSRPKRHFQ